MAKKKIEKEILYDGLGFPIILRNVPMVQVRDIWIPDINLNFFQKIVLLALAHHPTNLTGNQIRFARIWSGLTQTKFGKLFGVTHPAVINWEKSGNKGTKMNLSTQRDLRLWLLDQILTRDDDFRRAFKIIHESTYSNKIFPVEVDVPTGLVAI